MQSVNFGGTNRPSHFCRGFSANAINIFPVPNVAGTATFTLARMPTDDEAMTGGADEPVIPVEFHRDLVFWMLAEAYLVDVSDTKSTKNSDGNLAKFEARFGRKSSAKAEMQGRKAVIGSAATIVPTLKVCFVSGITTVNTIDKPADFANGGQITLIPTGLWSTGTSGNIALASTAVVNRALILTFDVVANKWYPSY